ncbi:hypothetical protein [Actinocrispum wychmicini]|nr:hypothetical protein [Actinocrispum wychmicini]
MRTGHLPRLIIALAGLCLAGCGATQAGSPAVESTTTPVSVGTTTSTRPSADKPVDQTTRPSSHTSATSKPAPTVSISVVRQPTCPVHGTPDAPFSSPGTDVIISWKVTGASGAAVAVDNPNIYGAYGMYDATGQLTLAFGCSGTTGKTTHTYTVWSAGVKDVSKTISVSATNNP